MSWPGWRKGVPSCRSPRRTRSAWRAAAESHEARPVVGGSDGASFFLTVRWLKGFHPFWERRAEAGRHGGGRTDFRVEHPFQHVHDGRHRHGGHRGADRRDRLDRGVLRQGPPHPPVPMRNRASPEDSGTAGRRHQFLRALRQCQGERRLRRDQRPTRVARPQGIAATAAGGRQGQGLPGQRQPGGLGREVADKSAQGRLLPQGLGRQDMIRSVLGALFIAALILSASATVMAGPEDGQSRLAYDP